MSQAVKCVSFLVCQDKDINKIENQLNAEFCNICDWFVNNKLIIHLGEDKTKSILFASEFKRKNIKKLHIKYGDIQIKQYLKVRYLRCLLDETLSGDAMRLNVVNKISNKLKFLYHKNSLIDTSTETLTLQCVNTAPFLLCMFCLVS